MFWQNFRPGIKSRPHTNSALTTFRQHAHRPRGRLGLGPAPPKWPAREEPEMLSDWNLLSDALQLVLTREALLRAAETIASQAELLAQEMERGGLEDRGGPDALRLLAAVVRVTGQDNLVPTGHA